MYQIKKRMGEGMIVEELTRIEGFEVIHMGETKNREITKPFCCDLLSFAMSRLPKGAAWVTVMGNVNTLAVAALTDAACIILAEGASMDVAAKEKAVEQGVSVFSTQLPIYEAASLIDKMIHA